jgi:hypothetical protein
MNLITLIKNQLYPKHKEKFFMPYTRKLNFKFKNDENSFLELQECSFCRLIKPINSMYSVKVDEKISFEKDGIVVSEIHEYWCEKCIKQYR